LIAAAIGLVGGLTGAYLGAHATIVTQREQAQESRNAESRTKRATVYEDFLVATNNYAVADARTEIIVVARCGRGALASDRRPVRKRHFKCDPPVGFGLAVSKTRGAFQEALNEVYVYGSLAGVSAAERIAKTLPPSEVGTAYTFNLAPVNDFSLTAAYDGLLRVMCREVTAEPRSHC